MRLSNRAISVGGLIFAVLCLAACGGGGTLLSANQANELKSQLDQVTQALNAHQCQQAANEISNFRSTVNGLGSVSSSLVDNLNQGTSTVSQLAARECPVTRVRHRNPATTATTAPTTTATPAPTTTATPAPTTTATTPPATTTPTTSTTPTTTTPSPTPTTTTPTGPGSGGAGLGGGNGNGNGNGNGAPTGGGD